jgi:ArsR family transcriptional regulator
VDVDATSEVLKAVGHPVRLRILRGLRSKTDCNVTEMARSMGLPQSTLSQHLGILRNRGIIEPRKEGVRTCYRIADGRIPRILDLFGLRAREKR